MSECVCVLVNATAIQVVRTICVWPLYAATDVYHCGCDTRMSSVNMHIYIAPTALGKYSADEIIDYVNSGGNVIVTSSLNNDAALTTFLNTFNVFAADKYLLQDNIKYNAADKQTDRANVLLQADSVAPWMTPFIEDFASLRPILAPSSAAMRYSTTSGYVSSALGAPRTSFSVTAGSSLSDMKKVIAGPQASVVAAVQTKKNSRILVMGTDALCSNATFETKVRVPGTKTKMPNGNGKFCEAAFKWAFQEVGVLRSSEIRHVHSGTQAPKAMYSINDEMVRDFDCIVKCILRGSRP